jgi:hypothetical protein
MIGAGKVWNTDPSHVIGITPNLQSTNLLITCDIVSHHTHLIGSVSLLVQDGSGSGWRVSTPLIRPVEVLRQTVRPLVVRRWDGRWDDVPRRCAVST